MPAAGNIYEIRIGGTLNGINTLNVFHYQCATGTPAALNLMITFNTNVIPSLQSMLSSAFSFTSQEAINLDDLTDFFTGLYSGSPGSVTGEYLSPFVTWAFIYNRGTRAARNGYKRFSGVAESYQQNGAATNTALTALNAAATAMGSTLTGGGSAPTYKPIILHKPTTRNPVRTAYAVSSVGYLRISTQNTRKT